MSKVRLHSPDIAAKSKDRREFAQLVTHTCRTSHHARDVAPGAIGRAHECHLVSESFVAPCRVRPDVRVSLSQSRAMLFSRFSFLSRLSITLS